MRSIGNNIFYFAFRHPIKDYFRVLNLKEGCFDWVFPLIIAIIAWFVFIANAQIKADNLKGFLSYVISLLAVLVGFTFTCITVLTTSSSASITELKRRSSKRRPIDEQVPTLYKVILANFTFTIYIEILALAIDLGYSIVSVVDRYQKLANIILVLNVFLLLNIIALNIRNVSNFYLTLWSEDTGV